MSKIKEMIRELCPDGVEMVKLGELCTIKTGKLNANAMVENGLYTFFTCSDELFKIDSYVWDCEALIVAGNGYIGNVKYFKGKFNAYQRTYVLTDFTIKSYILYVFHYLKAYFREHALNFQKEGSVPYITLNTLTDYEIPLPPLSIQQEIVSVLDTFTTLIDKMKQEVEKRKKQMEYYCDLYYGGDIEGMMALANDSSNSVITFAELGTITRGKRFVRDDVRESGQPCIHYGDMYTYYGTKSYRANTFLDRDFPKKMRYAKKGDVVIVGAGENDYDIGVGVVWMGDEPAAVHDACYILEHKQNPMYISYYLRSNIYHQQLKKYVSSGKISSFSADGLGKVYIPIQPMEMQEKIVSTLDKFESYITKLEKMITLRQKQYEYYREQLLTFCPSPALPSFDLAQDK